MTMIANSEGLNFTQTIGWSPKTSSTILSILCLLILTFSLSTDFRVSIHQQKYVNITIPIHQKSVYMIDYERPAPYIFDNVGLIKYHYYCAMCFDILVGLLKIFGHKYSIPIILDKMLRQLQSIILVSDIISEHNINPSI